MLKSFHHEFTKAQLTVVSNLSELHKARVLHHWRLVGIPMINHEVKCVGASTVANCHLYNHPFQTLYEITESGDEEKALFAAVTEHQIEADRVIGAIGSVGSHNVAGCPPVYCSVCVSGVCGPSLGCPLPTQGGQGKCKHKKNLMLTSLQQF